MRIHGFTFIAVLAASGCANSQLRFSTTRQASTITELQYQQVLNNLAMLRIDPDAIPALIAIKTGATQVSDQGNAMVGLAIARDVLTSPSLSGSRSIVDSWGTVPVTDDATLRLLRMAYQSALGRPRVLDPEEADDLAHAISAQIGTNADISVDGDTLRSLVANLKPTPPPSGSSSMTTKDARLVRTRAVSSPLMAQAQPDGALPARDDIDRFPPPPTRSTIPPPPARNPAPISPDGNQFPPPPTELRASPGLDVGKIEYTPSEVARTLRDLDNHITSTLDDPILVPEKNNWPLFRAKQSVATGLAKETIRQVNDIQKTLRDIPSGWFHVGGKHDVPKDACYVGHSSACGRECYVWVCPDGRAGLAEFTLDILSLSSAVKDTQVLSVSSGIQFSPVLSNPR